MRGRAGGRVGGGCTHNIPSLAAAANGPEQQGRARLLRSARTDSHKVLRFFLLYKKKMAADAAKLQQAPVLTRYTGGGGDAHTAPPEIYIFLAQLASCSLY